MDTLFGSRLKQGLIALSACAVLWAFQARAQPTLRYSSLVEKARESSAKHTAARTRLETAEVLAESAERSGLPTAQLTSTLSGRLERENARSGTASDRIGLGAAGDVGLEQSHLIGMQVPLFDGGKAAATQQKAEAGVNQSKDALAELDHELIHTVARLCARYLAADSFIAVAELQEQAAAAKFTEIRAAYRRGERSELDLTRAEFERARAMIARDRARGERQLLDRNLAALINSPNSPPPLELARRRPEDWVAFAARLGSLAILSPASARRTQERQAIQADLRLLEAADAPQLNALAGAGLAGLLMPLRPIATAQIQFVWPLPWNRSSGSERERLLLGIRAIDEAAADDDRIRQQGRIHAAKALELLRAEQSALSNQLEVLQRYRILMKRRYDAGRASALELGESEDQELSTRLELERTQSQITERILDYAAAIGFTDFAPFFEVQG